MYCSNCGTENAESSSYCSKCGQPINGTIPPAKKKGKKALWIIGSILAVILVCCVAPLGYGYAKIASIPTSTPIPTATLEPTYTPMPTDIAMPEKVVVNTISASCASVYQGDSRKPVDCIPNGEILSVIGNGPIGTISKREFWTIRWLIDGRVRFGGYIKRSDVSMLYKGDPTPTFIPTGKWVTKLEKSSFDGSQTVVLSLNANFPVSGWLDNTKVPTLIVRCQEKVLETYIIVGMQQDVEYGLYNMSTVRVRFDEDQAITMTTKHSTDGLALFFQDPNSFVNALLSHNKLIFGFTPFNSSPVETSFDLRGLTESIGRLQDVCK